MATQEQINIVARAAEAQAVAALNHCVGVYLADDKGHPELEGSGFLLATDQSKYLVTAAHVIDAQLVAGSPVYVPDAKGGIVEIKGDTYSTQKHIGGRIDDKVDLAVIRLNPECADHLVNDNFVRSGQIDLGFSSGDHSVCFVTGYPITKNKHVNKKERRVSRTPVNYTAFTLGVEKVKSIKANPESSLIIKFKKRHSQDSEGNDLTAPDPRGMSGGPLWKFDPKGNPMLVGVLIEYHEGERALLSTRIAIVAQMINKIESSSAPSFLIPDSVRLETKLESDGL